MNENETRKAHPKIMLMRIYSLPNGRRQAAAASDIRERILKYQAWLVHKQRIRQSKKRFFIYSFVSRNAWELFVTGEEIELNQTHNLRRGEEISCMRRDREIIRKINDERLFDSNWLSGSSGYERLIIRDTICRDVWIEQEEDERDTSHDKVIFHEDYEF